MPSAGDLKSAANRMDSGGAQPIPPIEVDPLPPRLLRIDPEGCEAWRQKLQMKLKEATDRMNAAVSKINDDVKKLQDAIKP